MADDKLHRHLRHKSKSDQTRLLPTLSGTSLQLEI
ncbi:hypothetical protein LSH36_8g14013 [Paralvinella palmiformis]|uniref:Uncharacterized protein n=1 Tax=Paralvinella palmiformis TaxID=53620 RepID=A0AAD9NIE1_9ANNE|nr:hypothetical protein LSH36_8g14013 [Paralvinella palmiformis]